eukprot:3270346-Prymnesium_polylepis.1
MRPSIRDSAISTRTASALETVLRGAAVLDVAIGRIAFVTADSLQHESKFASLQFTHSSTQA